MVIHKLTSAATEANLECSVGIISAVNNKVADQPAFAADLHIIQKAAFLMTSSNEPCHEKTNVLVSDQVRHKPGCTATEDG